MSRVANVLTTEFIKSDVGDPQLLPCIVSKTTDDHSIQVEVGGLAILASAPLHGIMQPR